MMIDFSDDLKDKNIIITGVSSGIGYAQAMAFLKNSANVYGIDIKKNNNIKNLNKFSRFHFYICDLRNLNGIQNNLNPLIINNDIHILLNTAGILDHFYTTLDTTEKMWDDIFDTNLKSIFRITNLVLPNMLKQHHGVIVNMASIAGIVAGGGGASYTASKFGIIGYTKQLDYNYAHLGIRANCIAPGAIKTPMNKDDFIGDANMAKKVASQTPSQRWAYPMEVANLTLFLSSSYSDYIHGVTIPIDGGWIENKK